MLQFEYGKALPKRKRRSGSVPVYGSAGRIGSHDEPLVDGPIIIIGRKGAAGTVSVSTGPTWVIDTAYYARVPPDQDPQFLSNVLKAHNLGRLDRSTAVPSLSRDDLKEVLLRFPPKAEQREIVRSFETRASALSLGSTYLAAVNRGLGNLRRSIVASAVQQGWPRVKINDVLVSLRNGVFVSRPAATPPGIPILRISSIRSLEFDPNDLRYAPDDLEPDRKFFVENDDLLFTRYSGNPNYVGACAVVSQLAEPVLYPDKLIRAVVDRSRADPAYLAFACSTGQTASEIASRRKTTAGQVGIAGGQLKMVTVPLPPLAVQQEVVAGIESKMATVLTASEGAARAHRQLAWLPRLVRRNAFRPDCAEAESTRTRDIAS